MVVKRFLSLVKNVRCRNRMRIGGVMAAVDHCYVGQLDVSDYKTANAHSATIVFLSGDHRAATRWLKDDLEALRAGLTAILNQSQYKTPAFAQVLETHRQTYGFNPCKAGDHEIAMQNPPVSLKSAQLQSPDIVITLTDQSGQVEYVLAPEVAAALAEDLDEIHLAS